MKKAVCLTAIVVAASLVLCRSAAAGTDQKFSVAASFGSYPFSIPSVATKNSTFHAGLEIGYQISGRLRVSGEFQYVDWSAKIRQDESSTGNFTDQKQTFSSTPILLSLTYVAPIAKTFTFFLGAGAGYHPSTFKTHIVFHEGGEDVIDTELKYGGHGIVPHISLGLETELSNRIWVFGQVRQLFGFYRVSSTVGTITTVNRFVNSGTELLAGVRFYI
jgi:hypothetical protein